jgi:protocatechuate 3,4-dioxygenase beta subunit
MNELESRRRIISYLGAAALAPLSPTPALGEGRSPTPRMTEGPFYPRSFPEDSDADLTRVTGRNGRAQGTPLEVSGRVVDRTGRAPHIHFTVAQGERVAATLSRIPSSSILLGETR